MITLASNRDIEEETRFLFPTRSRFCQSPETGFLRSLWHQTEILRKKPGFFNPSAIALGKPLFFWGTDRWRDKRGFLLCAVQAREDAGTTKGYKEICKVLLQKTRFCVKI
jgi:hypothetical protein